MWTSHCQAGMAAVHSGPFLLFSHPEIEKLLCGEYKRKIKSGTEITQQDMIEGMGQSSKEALIPSENY